MMTPLRIKIPQLNGSMKRGCPTVKGSTQDYVGSPKFRTTGMKEGKKAAGQRVRER